MIVLVAAFGIISTLVMLVMQKRKEIAILKSMGATNRSIMGLFVVQGFVIGVAGPDWGCCWDSRSRTISIRSWPRVEWLFGFKAFPAGCLSAGQTAVAGALAGCSGISCTSVLISLLATILPSRQAAAVDPVVAIRYE